MAGVVNSKLKLLRIMDILKEKTDEEHPMSANDLCDELEKYGIDAERKSIYSDMKVLTDYGMDIINARGVNRGFYLGERDFELAEIRLLIDAVQSAKFITPKKTRTLIEKIEGNVSKSQRESLAKQVYVERRIKNDNEQIYYNIDALSKAISNGQKVRLHYTKRKIEAGEKSRHEERIFTVSPYALIWTEDHYYLVCNNQKYDNLMHLRIDRMKRVETLDEKVRNFAEVSEYKNYFDSADYISKVFNMYSGEPERVLLRCDNDLLETVIDRFGDEVPIVSHTEDTFTVAVSAAVSDGLTSWIVQFAPRMVVESPASLKDAVHQRLKDAVKAYED